MENKKPFIAIFILSIALACSLAYIFFSNVCFKDATSQNLNTQTAQSWDKETRLPLGSIFTTADGTWMVIGQKPVTYVNDDYVLGSSESWTFDYYCVPYPEGCRTVYSEFENTALYNKSDIQNVLYIGKIDSEDKEYRNWIDNYDTTLNNPTSTTSHRSGGVYPQAPCIVEQQLRMQGKTTAEIYGDNYRSGELGNDLVFSGMYFINSEWWNAALAQSNSSNG